MPPFTRYYERYTIRPRGIEAAASESGRPQGAVDLAQLQDVGCTHQFKVRRGPAGIIVYPPLVSHGGLYGGMRWAVRCQGEAGRGRHRRGHARPPALLADQVRLDAAHSSVGQSSLDDYPPGWRRVEEAQQWVGAIQAAGVALVPGFTSAVANARLAAAVPPPPAAVQVPPNAHRSHSVDQRDWGPSSRRRCTADGDRVGHRGRGALQHAAGQLRGAYQTSCPPSCQLNCQLTCGFCALGVNRPPRRLLEEQLEEPWQLYAGTTMSFCTVIFGPYGDAPYKRECVEGR
jgi:hypothetical protein